MLSLIFCSLAKYLGVLVKPSVKGKRQIFAKMPEIVVSVALQGEAHVGCCPLVCWARKEPLVMSRNLPKEFYVGISWFFLLKAEEERIHLSLPQHLQACLC